MGRVAVNIDIATLTDPPIHRTVETLADTGATFLCLPQGTIDALGVKRVEERRVALADGLRHVMGLYGPLMVRLNGFGSAPAYAVGMPDGSEPLLGYTIMEELGVAVDMASHRLTRVDADLK